MFVFEVGAATRGRRRAQLTEAACVYACVRSRASVCARVRAHARMRSHSCLQVPAAAVGSVDSSNVSVCVRVRMPAHARRRYVPVYISACVWYRQEKKGVGPANRTGAGSHRLIHPGRP